MGRDWEDTFRRWKEPLGATEQTKCENAERMIRSAIKENEALKNRTIEVFTQGSYQNNTNVQLESDVDICVLCSDTAFYDLTSANGITKSDVGISDATYHYSQYKSEVEQAIIDKFGIEPVSRGDKAIRVRANSYRVDADVVACFEHWRYLPRRPDGTIPHEIGTGFLTDKEQRKYENWPKQNYKNGTAKNRATGDRFKYMVRVLKNLKIEMDDRGIREAGNITSFPIECLLWNVPNDHYGHDQYTDDVLAILNYLYIMTSSDPTCSEWREVNELKYLFRSSQPWTRDGVNKFVSSAWSYIGLK